MKTELCIMFTELDLHFVFIGVDLVLLKFDMDDPCNSQDRMDFDELDPMLLWILMN